MSRSTTDPRSSLSLSIERRGSAVVVSILGSFEGEATSTMERILDDLIVDQGNLDIVIDLRGVDSIDMASIDVLAAAKRRMDQHWGNLALADPMQRVRGTLHRYGL